MNQDKLKWFCDARYGLFIHFGLYAIPGGKWNGELSPGVSEWIMKNMKIPLAEYRELAKNFNPCNFDARYYVRRAKEWGMKYIVFTAKHHDGFAMYDTAVSDYSIMNTPYGKDIVRQFSDACAEEGMTFCLYYSQFQDWEHPHGNGNTWDYNPEKQNFRICFYEKIIPQVKELLTNYGKIGLMWFDTPYDMPTELCRELRETVHQCQPECLINGRIGYGLGDYRQAADNSIPLLSKNEAWESPMTLNHSWGFSYHDKDFKTPSEVLENMVSVVGKGGNLLLNIGPDKSGKIPQQSDSILCEVGKWLRVNGDSIYQTSAIPNFPYLLTWGNLTYDKDKHILYCHIKKFPSFSNRILLTGLITKVESVNLLSDGTPLRFRQSYEPARDEHRFHIFIPETCPDANDTVIAVRLAGEAVVQTL